MSVPYGTVSNLEQDGATGASYEADDYMGFSFDIHGTHYEYALTGVSATSFLVKSPPLPGLTPPIADAGPDQTVASAALVTLDGSASSDPDEGQTLTYAWTAPAGITLSDTAAASPTFTAPTLATGDPDQTLTFSLIVTDDLGLASTADEVTITVTAPTNQAPTADAGPDQTVPSSAALAVLDGSASSDTDAGQTLTYAWTAPTGIALDDPTSANPIFEIPTLAIGDADLSLVFQLIVTDNLGFTSEVDEVTITVKAPVEFLPVTANAGDDQYVLSGADPVTLDGSRSINPNSSVMMSYAWTQIGGPSVELRGADTATASFTAPVLEDGVDYVILSFHLTVGVDFFDGGFSYAGDIVYVSVARASTNQAPTADAGPDQTVASAAPVTLDGSASSDPDEGQTLAYAWTAPAGITLSDATDASPNFTAPTLATGDPDQTLTFSLIVTDDLGRASAADEVTITVTALSDTVAPDAPTLVVNGNPDGTVTASGTAEPGSVVTVTFPDGSTVTTTAADDSSYRATSAAAQPSGDVTATATDAAGNVSPEASKAYVAADTVSETQEKIAGFMLGRANNLASNQPGMARFLMGEGCGNFNANATKGSGSVSGCVTRGNTWAEINGSWSGDGSYTLGTIGTHASLNPNLLVGGMVQFDYTDDPANNASGKGWMVGPYFVAKTPNQPLYFEGRLLYGQTDNEIMPLGTYTDSFETERLLAQLRASGQFELKNTTLMPLLDFTYTEDRQKAYTDSLGNTIPDQTVDLMQVSAGLDFSTPLSVQMGSLELTGGIKGIYSSSNGATAAPEFESWRGRTHIGLNYDTGRGTTVRFGSFYDGLGTNYESYGANLNFDMRF